MPQHVEHCTLNNPRGAFKFINFLAQLYIVAQASLPNPYGWNKSWKLRKLDYHSPAVDQKRRQTTWIEVHQWHLKPEASNTMKKPLLVTVPAFQSFLDRSPQQNDHLWRARNIVQTRLLCPTRLRVVLNQLLSESPPSAVKTQAAWFNFQRPLWP